MQIKPSQMAPYGQMVRFLKEKLTEVGFDSIFPLKNGETEQYTIIFLKYPENRKRIEVAYDMVRLISEYDSDNNLRSWFFGSNSFLNNDSPAKALRDGNFDRVEEAVQHYQ